MDSNYKSADSELPELDNFEIEEIVQEYKSVYQAAVNLSSAFVEKSLSDFSATFIVSEWSQRNLERGTSTKIQRTLLCDKALKEGVTVNTVDISSWVLNAVSKSENLKAVIHTTTEGKNTKYFLEIWNEEKSLMNFDLASLDLHGPVYSDDLFGSLSWSPQEDKVLYIAEKSQPKTAPFYQQKSKPESDEKSNKPLVGAQHLYEDDWGEQMSPKRQSVIAICDIKSKSIRILDGLPENVCPGQVIWNPAGDGVVGVAWYPKPRRLGVVFCTNRECEIFHLSSDGKYNVLSDKSKAVLSPRFSPNGKNLIWLQRTNVGPHFTCSELVKYNWETKEVDLLVETTETVKVTDNGKEFYGIFASTLPRRCWTSDSKYILFNSVQKYRINSYVVDVEDKSILDIGSEEEVESVSILDVSEDDYVIGCSTSLNQPTALVSLSLRSILAGKPCAWNCLTESVKYEKNIIDQFTVYDSRTQEERCFATYFGPQCTSEETIPLILYPHGGPHSAAPSIFRPSFHLFSRLGFGVLIVHYRGSIGCGKKFLDALPGNVGSLDVEDCFAALQNVLQKCSWLDKNRVLLFGGSHGGFLVTHLSSKYPDDFISTVALNPVTNFPGMLFTTDIPEWILVESGRQYNGMAGVIDNPDIWGDLVKVSPITYIKNVKTPTLLLLGKKDLRVPSFQGLSYYEMLKELKIPTKAFYYDDNHSLSSVPVEMDSVINAIIWFKRCLRNVIK